ncbi:MAG: hypothetical protein QM731_10820 [Chitinophagaceae bacterium]
MKKYLVGSLALVIAVAAVAFKNPTVLGQKKFVDYYFHFVGTAGTEANPANWDYIGSTNTESCNAVSQASCVIRVDADVVAASGTDFIIDEDLLDSKYSITQLPVQTGSGSNQIPNTSAKPGLYLTVVNKSL